MNMNRTHNECIIKKEISIPYEQGIEA